MYKQDPLVHGHIQERYNMDREYMTSSGTDAIWTLLSILDLVTDPHRTVRSVFKLCYRLYVNCPGYVDF